MSRVIRCVLLSYCVVALPPAVAEDVAEGGWLATVGSEIAASEYRFGRQPDGRFQAPNRAQGFRARVHESGFDVVSRTEGEAGFRLSWTLARWGRHGAATAAESGPVVANGPRATIRRPGLDEWLVNDPEGLEHGFTIHAAPGVEVLGRVELHLLIDGTMGAYPQGVGSVVFRSGPGGPSLSYSDLRVYDATGRELPASMGIREGVLVIGFDDTTAVYPITVDPKLSAERWSARGNQAGARFGESVATAGDVNGDGYSDIVVGASAFDSGETDEGKVFVYLGSASGPATTPSWTAEPDVAGAGFGSDVAAAGDVDNDGYDDLIVGASAFNGGQSGEGKVFVYHGSSTGLAATFAWTFESNQAGARLGGSVAGAGDVNGDGYADVIVGAREYSNGNAGEGRAWVFHGSATGLSTLAAWTGESNNDLARFGSSVATAGDVNGDGFDDIVVGAERFSGGESGEGRAYVYHGSSLGVAVTPAWTFESNQAWALLGGAVSTVGDVNGDGYADVVVGAYAWDEAGIVDAGCAYVFHGSSNGVATTAAVILTQDVSTNAFFGTSVATAGDVNGDGFADVLIGRPNPSGIGNAFVYIGTAAGVDPNFYWKSFTSGPLGSEFGADVATAGDVNGDGFSDVIVGAPFYDGNQSDEGKASVHYGGGDGIVPTPTTQRLGGQSNAQMGYALASAGDVNGDGFSDVIVGAPFYDGGQADEGRAFVYHGSASGLSAAANWSFESDQALAQLGRSVAGVGDVNNDGYDDVVVGAPLYETGTTVNGRVVLFRGGSGGLTAAPVWTLDPPRTTGSEHGRIVAGAGDVNGDGFADVLVAAWWSWGQTGFVDVYLGGSSGPQPTPDWSVASPVGNDGFSHSAGPAGDVNRDGFSDVIVGAPLHDGSHGLDEGRVYLYLGSATGLPPSPSQTILPNQMLGQLGYTIATIGDCNGDGHSDVAIDHNGGSAYSLRIYYGNSLGLGWAETLEAVPVEIGRILAGSGDLDGDGYSDLAVNVRWPGGPDTEWRVQIRYGSATGFHAYAPPDLELTTPSGFADATFGGSLATAGDVNGDGFADLLVGAPKSNASAGAAGEGVAHLYYGGGRDGLDRVPRQQQPDSTSAPPAARLGKSTQLDAIRLRSRARSAAGRTRVRVEYEVKPLDIPFDGTGTVFSSELLSSAPASDGTRVNYSSRIGSLLGGPHHHWRLRFRSTSPLFPFTRWFSMPGIGRAEKGFMTSCTPTIWYRDVDGDGFGRSSQTGSWCVPMPGYVATAGDCDDTDGTVYPGAPEQCDGIDHDCDGASWSQPPPEVAGVRLSHSGGVGGDSVLTWNETGAGDRYDVIRSATPGGFDAGSCVATDTTSETATDVYDGSPFAGYYYLVAAENPGCGRGSLGSASGGPPRSARACP